MPLDWLKKATTTSPPAGLGKGGDGRRVVDTDEGAGGVVKSGGETLDGKLVVQRRHIDWTEHQIRWRWLLDSYEGGDRYRNAVYGADRRGLPGRNLFRHRREYPDPQAYPQVYQGFASNIMGSATSEAMMGGLGPYPGQLGADSSATALDDDYEYRRSRTPIPEFVAEAVEVHLSKICDQEIHREGPDDLKAWWEDCDGRGTSIDDWMRETVSPLLLVLGCLDVLLDHPKAPPGQKVVTRSDELALGLDRCVASYILPQNMVWWRLDPAGRYQECLVREYVDPADRQDCDKNGNAIDPDGPGNVNDEWRNSYIRWRLWRSDESILFSFDGEKVLERVPHQFGCVPIVRLVDLPRHRSPHIGKSRYEAIAEYQREYYNRDSELILSDTLQAHPFLSGAEDFCKSDNTLSVGPGYVLPMKKNPENGTYQGWEFVSPPKDPAESLRKNKQDIVDMKDRRACLTKPAGATGGSHAGSGSSTVSQSGVSKQLDQHGGHKLLTAICKTLAKVERQVAEHVVVVLRDGPIEREVRGQIKIVYPQKFELSAAAEMTTDVINFQKILSQTGECPQIECGMLQTLMRMSLPGETDEKYEIFDAELELFVQTKAQLKEQQREMAPAGFESHDEAMQGPGSVEQDAGDDPTGESAGTMVSNVIPVVV